jgi:hypothetical protein
LIFPQLYSISIILIYSCFYFQREIIPDKVNLIEAIKPAVHRQIIPDKTNRIEALKPVEQHPTELRRQDHDFNLFEKIQKHIEVKHIS